MLFHRDAPELAAHCFACPMRHVLGAMSNQSPTDPGPISPTPPSLGPGTAQFAGPALAPAANRAPAALPRPALLTLANPHVRDIRGRPDALEPAGAEAATVVRPAPLDATRTRASPARSFAAPAPPEVTQLQFSPTPPRKRRAEPAHRPSAHRPARPPSDARAFFVLNLCLGAMICVGIAALLTHEVAPGPTLPPPLRDHATR